MPRKPTTICDDVPRLPPSPLKLLLRDQAATSSGLPRPPSAAATAAVTPWDALSGDLESENELLRGIAADLKVERDALQGRADRAEAAAAASRRAAEASDLECRRLRVRVEELGARHDAAARELERTKQHAADVEDAAIDLKQRADAAERSAAAATARASTAESRLAALGLGDGVWAGSSGNRSESASLLLSRTMARVQELSAALEDARVQAAADTARLLEQGAAREAKWRARFNARRVEAEAATREAELKARQAEGACKAAEAKYEALLLATSKSREQREEAPAAVPAATAAAKAIIIKQHPATKDTCNAATQTGLPQQQQQQQHDRQRQEEKKRQMQVISSSNEHIAVLHAEMRRMQRAAEADHKRAAEAALSNERLRGEVARCTIELQRCLNACADAGRARAALEDALRLKSDELAAQRRDCGELRAELAERAAATRAAMRDELAAESRSIAGLNLSGDMLPLAVTAYIKVLEASVVEAESGAADAARRAHAAAEAEQAARAAAALAHERAALAERALHEHSRRLRGLEGMRLRDLHEAQGLEWRLAAAQEEAWAARDLLAKERLGRSAAAAGLSV